MESEALQVAMELKQSQALVTYLTSAIAALSTAVVFLWRKYELSQKEIIQILKRK